MSAPSSSSASSKIPVGRMLNKCSSPDNMPEMSWCNVSGTTFETRIGPDYASQKKKDSSKQCIYECAAIDLYTTDAKISHVGRLMDLPGDHLDDAGNDGYLPPTFIVNFQIPNYPVENALWGQCAGDGPGYSLVFYFVLSEYGRQQVSRKGQLESAADSPDSHYHGSLSSNNSTPRHKPHHSHSLMGMFSSLTSSSSTAVAHQQAQAQAAAAHALDPNVFYYSHTDPACFKSKLEPCNAAVRLLHNFVRADEGTELRQRFKAITRMMNVDEVGLGTATKKLIQTYNSTPFLIRTCSVFWRGDKYFEVDVDVHRFSYTARLGLSGVRERIKDVVFDFGFVIEGHSDFELPENMLGAVRLSKLDLSLAKTFPA